MEKLATTVQSFRPWLVPLLVVLIVIAAILAVVLLVRWWMARRAARLPAGASEAIPAGRLLEARRRFLSGLPFRYRSTVDAFPTTVVLGPAGAGKSRVIDSDVDWRRQANQFMPSYTEDPLLQIYLGPDLVVQEVAAPLMEDGAHEVRRALTRLWSRSFGKTQPMVVVVLDVNWITRTPPDELRRVTQLLRGKINIIAEIVEAEVETRLCLTHLDEVEGFTDFASLLLEHGVPLSFELPERGREAEILTGLRPYEQYLAVALTSLSVEAFERLESFFTQGGALLEALSRFVVAFREGGAMARPARLSRYFLFSPTPEARSLGIFARPAGERKVNTRAQYLAMHLRRCAAILIAGTLPMAAVYGNMYYRINRAKADVAQLSRKVRDVVERKKADDCRSLAEAEEQAAVRSYAALSEARRWWPPLRSSFSDARRRMRADLATGIRECFLQPVLDHCQDSCAPGGVCTPSCSREQALYMEAVIYSARGDDLGRFVLRQSGATQDEAYDDLAEVLAPVAERKAQFGNLADFAEALSLPPELIATYIGASDEVYGGEWKWKQMPFHNEPAEQQFVPWLAHFNGFEQLLRADEVDREQWDAVRLKGKELDSALQASLPFRNADKVARLLTDSVAPVEPRDIAGLDGRLVVLKWLDDNRPALSGFFRMQEQAERGYQQAAEMPWAELLTRADGLFVPGDADAHYDFEVLVRPFTFRAEEISRRLLEKLLRAYEHKGRLALVPAAVAATNGRDDEAVASFDDSEARGSDKELASVVNRAVFDTDVRPKIEEFTRRMASSKLPQAEASQRVEYVLGEVEWFARDYARALRWLYDDYQFRASSCDELHVGLSQLGLPASTFTTSLREVAHRADLGKLEGPYFERIRSVVTPYAPIVALMKANKDGTYAELDKYLGLVAELDDEVGACGKRVAQARKKGEAGGDEGEEGDKAGGDKAGGDKAGGGKAGGAGVKGGDDKTPVSTAPGAARPAADKGAATADKPAAARSGSGPRLEALLTPLGQAALPMLLDEEDNYLKRVDAWLDEEHIVGNLRRRFRQPFEVAAALGAREIERVVRVQWEDRQRALLTPLLARFPFDPRAREEIDATELDVLRRKDGRFWEFVDRVLAPVLNEDAAVWTLRKPLIDKLALPDGMLETLNHFDRIAHLLWDDEGNRKPLALQVRPLPLPNKQLNSYYVTMSYLKAGPVFVFGYNQQPAWQDFPLVWWNQETASVGLQRTSPDQAGKKYRSIDVSGRGWSFYRLLEKAQLSSERVLTWKLPIGGAEEADIPKNLRIAEVRFGLRGDPWAPFRRR